MALPKIDKPLFDLKIPSMDKTVKCRPFVVKEEKILLIAQQSGQERDIVLAIKQVLNNCIQDPTVDVEDLTTFDIEYMFLKLRARSVNNIIEVSYRDNEDDKVYSFSIDLDTVEMLQERELNNKIEVSENIGIIMKMPSASIVNTIPENLDATEVVYHLIRKCIDQIYDEKDVYLASETTEEELTEFLDNLDVETFGKIREYFANLPTLYHKIEYKNTLGNDRVIELTTLNDFFTWG